MYTHKSRDQFDNIIAILKCCVHTLNSCVNKYKNKRALN